MKLVRNIVLLFSDVTALYSKTAHARPKNNIKTPLITPSKFVFVLSKRKNSASNAKKRNK